MTYKFNSIKPEVFGPRTKYSPRLYRYMKANARRIQLLAYTSPSGAIYIGYMPHDGSPHDNSGFTGKSLNNILAGNGTQGYYIGLGPQNMVLIEDFWPKYIELGRCYIDPEHTRAFQDIRWDETGDERTCRWCGRIEHRERFQETIDRERWVKS